MADRLRGGSTAGGELIYTSGVTKLSGWVSSEWETNGQDLKCRGDRALVGTTSNLIINYSGDFSGGVRVESALIATGTVTAPTFSGALSGNASTATWADTVDVNGNNTSSTWYDIVWHSSDTLFSSSGVEIQGSTNSIRATTFHGALSGTASNVTVTNSTSATNYPVVWHNNSNQLYDTTGKFMFTPSTGRLNATQFKVGTASGYFIGDSSYTSFISGNFYIQSSVPIFYNYASTTYHGNTSGDAQKFRGNTLDGDDWSLNGGTGTFTTTGNVSANNYTVNGVMTFKGGSHSGATIDALDGGANGTNLIVSTGGNLVLGSGESTGLNAVGSGNTGENVYLGADSTVYIYSNAQTWSSKQTATFSTAGVFSAPAFSGAFRGNADTASKWITPRTLTTTLTGDVTGTGSMSVDGSGNKTTTINTTVGNDSHGHTRLERADPASAHDYVMEYINTSSDTSVNPGTDWYNTIRLGHGDPITYYSSSIAVGMTGSNTGQLFTRTIANGTVNAWKKYFNDDYHPNADKWTTARTLTTTLTGDVTGSASMSVDGSVNKTVTISTVVGNDSHSHSNYLSSTSSDTFTGDTITFDTSAKLRLLSTQDVSATSTAHAFQIGSSTSSNLAFDNNEIMSRLNGVADVLRLQNDGGTVTINGQTAFHNGYHPNADKWTTARTLTTTLTGDVTGSASMSVDGSANKTVTISTVVGNNSHSHSNYVPYSTGGNITIHADSDSSSASEYMSLKAGQNDLRVTSNGASTSASKLTYNGSTVWHSGNDGNGSALDAGKLQGRVISDSTTGTTVAGRNSSGDIYARLFRSTYANSTSISGAMPYRVNNSSDNYIRFCSSGSAIRSFIGAAASSHTHSYLPLSGGTLTGDLTIQSDDADLFIRTTDSSSADIFMYNTEGGVRMYTDADDFYIQNTDAGTSGQDIWIRCLNDSSVSLYHNNSIKIATTSSGGTVTGTLNATTALQEGGVSLSNKYLTTANVVSMEGSIPATGYGWYHLSSGTGGSGGIKVNYGRTYVAANSTSGNITFPSAYNTPMATGQLKIVITPEASTTGDMDGWGVNTITPGYFKITNGYGSAAYFHWIAYGL